MKTGIVFEGGAYRTVFSCGVMDALIKKDIYPDYMIGVSAGAGYGVSYAAHQYQRNIRILMRYCDDKRYLWFFNIFKKNNRSIFGLDFAFNTVPNKLIPFDYDAYDKYGVKLLTVMTNAYTGKAEYKPYNTDDKVFTVLQATCALPLLFPMIYIDDVPYLDGGIVDPIPYMKAFNDGCDRVIVVSTREKGYRKIPNKKLQHILPLYKKYPKLQDAFISFYDTYNYQMQQIEELEKSGKIMLFSPKSTKNIKMMEKDKTKLLHLYYDGFNQVLKKEKKVKDFWGI